MFDVYVVGSTESGTDGLDRLAEAMSQRYGLPLEDLRARLGRGRFRVKANVDRATGDAYVRDLGMIGGKCILEKAATGAGQSIPPPIAVPTPRAGSTSTPPAGTAATPRATNTPPAGVYQSGLSAAFSASDLPASDLGALSRGDGLALSSIDGEDVPNVSSVQFAPHEPAPAPKPVAKPAAKPAAAAKPPRPKDVPVELDPFKPPDADDDDRPVEIAADEIEHRARKRMSTPPATQALEPPPPAAPAAPMPTTPAAVAAAGTSPPLMRRSSPSISPVQHVHEHGGVVRARSRLGPFSDERVRFAAGVLLAILIGFVPAHVIASMRERAAFHSVDATVEQKQTDVTAQEDYDALDAFRARQLEDKRSARRNIELMAFVIWGAVGSGVAYGWFKSIPWDRLDAPA